MKNTILRVLLFLTALLIFASCGKGKPKTIPSLTTGQPQGTDADGITLTTQFPVYSPDCESVSVILSNASGDRVEFGSYWLLEREEKGEWRMVPFVEDFGFTQELISIADGGDWGQKCLLKYFTSAVTEGHYRIAKEVNGAFYYAEFDLAEDAPITAETPFGMAPLDQLPKDYGAEQAIADGVVLEELDGTVHNADAVLAFFETVKIPHLSASLRTGDYTYEGDLILEDLFWDGEKLRVTMDVSRDRFDCADEYVMYYSTFTEVGTSVYLSNSDALSANYMSVPGFRTTFDLHGKESYTPDPRVIEIVRSLPHELKAYSADGTRHAGANHDEPLSYWLTAEMGMMHSVNSERTKDYPDAKIVDFAWEGNTLMVMVQLDESRYYYEFVDSDTREVVSYTDSQYPYEILDGNLYINGKIYRME